MDPLEQARAEAEALRAVSAEAEAGGLRGRLSQAAEPLARAQRAFNDAVLRLSDRLSERIDAAAARAGGGGRLSHAAEPLARAQRAFNDAVLRLSDRLSERIDAAAARAGEAERRSREPEERLLRRERRGSDAPQTVAAQPRQDALPDYFAFESRLRGSTEEV